MCSNGMAPPGNRGRNLALSCAAVAGFESRRAVCYTARMLGLLSYLTSPIGLISLGLLVLCVVHSVRTGNVFPWIYVMVFLPGIGPLIYFFVVIVPELTRSLSLIHI